MMNKRGPRPVVFVCIADNPSKIGNSYSSLVIEAASQNEAASRFLEVTALKAQTIHGPFRPKRAQVMENTRTLKFTDQSRKAIYNDWEVNALILKEPADHAYLIFLKRMDGKKLASPKGTIVVPISDLRINNE